MKTSQRGSAAPEVNHLRPLMTYSSPSRSIRVSMFVASELATAGSVIANPERIGAVEQRTQPPLLLRVGADEVQQLHVAGVGRRAVGGFRGEVQAPPGQLGERGVLELGEAGLLGEEEVPEAELLGRLLQVLHDRRQGGVVGTGGGAVLVVRRLRGEDVLGEEPGEQALELDGAVGGLGIGGIHQMSVTLTPACAR